MATPSVTIDELEIRVRALLRERGLEVRPLPIEELVEGQVAVVVERVGGSRRLFADRWTADRTLRSVWVTRLDPEAAWDFDLLWSLNRCSHPGDGRSNGDAQHVVDVVDAWLCRLVRWEDLPPCQPLRAR